MLSFQLEADRAGRAPKVERQHFADQAAGYIVAPFPFDLLRPPIALDFSEIVVQ